MTPVLAFRFPPQRQFDNDCREQALSLFTNRLGDLSPINQLLLESMPLIGAFRPEQCGQPMLYLLKRVWADTKESSFPVFILAYSRATPSEIAPKERFAVGDHTDVVRHIF